MKHLTSLFPLPCQLWRPPVFLDLLIMIMPGMNSVNSVNLSFDLCHKTKRGYDVIWDMRVFSKAGRHVILNCYFNYDILFREIYIPRRPTATCSLCWALLVWLLSDYFNVVFMCAQETQRASCPAASLCGVEAVQNTRRRPCSASWTQLKGSLEHKSPPDGQIHQWFLTFFSYRTALPVPKTSYALPTQTSTRV